MGELPIAPIGRIIKNAGGQRISQDAEKTLEKVLEQWGEKAQDKQLNLQNMLEEKPLKQQISN